MDLLFSNIETYPHKGTVAVKDGLECYAATGWTPEDVVERITPDDVDRTYELLTEEQAVAFLERNATHIVDAMIQAGYEAIDQLWAEQEGAEP